MNFTEALSALLGDESNKITRADWDKEEYGLMREGKLQIHLKDGYHDWVLSYGDLMAEDWKLI